MTASPTPAADTSSRPEPAIPASVIVLAYNSADTLGACLASLSRQVAGIGAQLLVVDNASHDGSAEIATAAGAQVVSSPRNLGFAGGCNLGAAASDGRVVVLVNPDTELDPGALAALVEAATAGAGPVGGRARHRDGSFDQRCVMGRPRLRGAISFALGLDTLLRGSRLFDPEHGPEDIPAQGPPVRVDAVSGAVMAVDRGLWDELGGLDERYFVYGEDVDLCIRAEQLGRHAVVAPRAGYHHVGGMAVDGTSHRRTLLHRGKVELYRQHLAEPAATIAVGCLQAGALLRGLPAMLPARPRSAATRDRARPWLELFRRRREWRGGHSGAQRPVDVSP